VLVLDAGRVVEDGSPAELAGGSGGYGGLHQAWAASLV
jgi:ATP-binding cassette subfamily B protein